MDQEHIGKFIAQLRKEKGWTQEQFAEQLGVNSRSVSRWENGRCIPDLSLLQIVADLLDVTMSELLNGHRMTEEEMLVMQQTIQQLLGAAHQEEQKKTRKLNCYFLQGLLCMLVVFLHQQFGILSWIFQPNMAEFACGVLTGGGLMFELIGIYNNNHSVPLKQKKQEFFRKIRAKISRK